MIPTGPDPATELVATQFVWLEVLKPDSGVGASDQLNAAREYVRAIDAYVADLKLRGRRIPYHLDEVAEKLRRTYGDVQLTRTA